MLRNTTVAAALEAVQALDLDSVKTRIMDPHLGEGWSREHADSIEWAYRNYLTMLIKYPEDAEDILLSKDVDEFWHTHILQTLKYTKDCESVFGTYLHHTPHVGPVTREDVERRSAQAEKTRLLYQREFHDATDAAWSGATAVKAESAAWSGATAVKAESAAWSGATAVKSENAAWSGATAVKAENAAWSGAAAVKAENAAWSGATAVKAENAAWSGATAVKAENAAWSGATAPKAGTTTDAVERRASIG